MLPQQYIKLSNFAEIGVNGKWYIDKGNGTFDGTCTCIYMYVNVHGYLIGVYSLSVCIHNRSTQCMTGEDTAKWSKEWQKSRCRKQWKK